MRTITIQDSDAEIELTLWRELANQPITIGDYVEVSHSVVAALVAKKKNPELHPQHCSVGIFLAKNTFSE